MKRLKVGEWRAEKWVSEAFKLALVKGAHSPPVTHVPLIEPLYYPVNSLPPTALEHGGKTLKGHLSIFASRRKPFEGSRALASSFPAMLTQALKWTFEATIE